MRILGLNGASEKNGTVAKLLDQSIDAAGAAMMTLGLRPDTEQIHLCDCITDFYESDKNKPPASVARLHTKMRQADGFILASPVHWFNVSAIMKSFLDWLTPLEADGFALEGKVAGVIVHCHEDGANQAAMNLIAPLLHMGLLIPPYCAFFRNKYAAGKSEDTKWQTSDHRLVGRNVVRLAQRVRSQEWQ